MFVPHVDTSEHEAAGTVGKWIAETGRERRRLEALLGRTPTTTLTAEDIKSPVASLQDITATLAAADPADKAKVYAEMGSVPVVDYTNVSVGDSVLGEVTSERSKLEQVSKHPPDFEERLGPDNSQPIDEPMLRDRLHVLTFGIARMIEA